MSNSQISYTKPIYYDTLEPYIEIEHTGIQYTVCRAFNHISRYRGLRQVIHNPNDADRFVTLETPNVISTNAAVSYYTVPAMYENRLDLIAYKFFGSTEYSWILSYLNNIEDGYTVAEGQRLKILDSFNALFSKGEILAAISALQLQLGSE